jgi:hypothetical protein
VTNSVQKRKRTRNGFPSLLLLTIHPRGISEALPQVNLPGAVHRGAEGGLGSDCSSPHPMLEARLRL